MKTNISRQLYLLLLFLTTLSIHTTLAQDYPPAQGPPLPTAPITELGSFILINMVENTIKNTIDSANAKIQRDKPTTGVNAKVSFSYELHKPNMTTTMLKDQPNQNVLWFPFSITYNITDIRYKGIPYFSRKIYQSIDVNVSCKDWFTNNGVLNVAANIQQPYLDGASFGEQVLNFFIANTLTNYVDGKIRSTLPGAMRSSTSIPTSPCNCLGVNSGTQAQRYKDGSIQFALKRGPRVPIGTAFNMADVTLLSIKRLTTRSFPNREILYKEVEDIQLLFYVNNTLRVAEVNQIKEGETRNLTVQKVSFSKPKDTENIVLIANVEQLPLMGDNKDSRFAIYNKNTNFGKGTQRMVVTKSYWEKPQKLPGGGMTKPREVKIDAYELTVQINIPAPEVSTTRGN